MKNIFTSEVSNGVIDRINQLTPTTNAQWGKMSVDQMLAHCSVPYEMLYEPEKFKKPNAIMRFLLKTLVKKMVVSEKPFKKNGPTAPGFLMKEKKDFEAEKKKLTQFIQQTQALGEAHFDGKVSPSFGPLNKVEWNNFFYKHLDHHLTQFNV